MRPIQDHLVNHIQKPYLRSDNTLHVIGVVTNVARWHSRYRLARKWLERMNQMPNVKAYVVEAAYKDRDFEVAEACNPRHLRLHTKSEIWLKENLINLGVKRLLPHDWRYMAWVDMDVHFRRSDWALATIHQLQHYPVVQPWSDVVDLDFYGGVHGHYRSFGSLHARGVPKCHHKKHEYGHAYAHPGFAWACTRSFYEAVEKLLEFCIVGAGDHHMAWAMVGDIESTIHRKVSENYKIACRQWQEKATFACGHNVGYVPGSIEHNFHGPKERRYYYERWDILLKHQFDPLHDLTHDSQGLLVLKNNARLNRLERAIHRYNLERLEDSIEMY